MALTREFKDTVAARVQRDRRFREALFTEAMNAYLGGDTRTGKSMLRDLVNATVGFEELASVLKKPSKSLHRMLASHGNPSIESFFGIVNALQKKTRVKLHLTAKAPATFFPIKMCRKVFASKDSRLRAPTRCS